MLISLIAWKCHIPFSILPCNHATNNWISTSCQENHYPALPLFDTNFHGINQVMWKKSIMHRGAQYLKAPGQAFFGEQTQGRESRNCLLWNRLQNMQTQLLVEDVEQVDRRNVWCFTEATLNRTFGGDHFICVQVGCLRSKCKDWFQAGKNCGKRIFRGDKPGLPLIFREVMNWKRHDSFRGWVGVSYLFSLSIVWFF